MAITPAKLIAPNFMMNNFSYSFWRASKWFFSKLANCQSLGVRNFRPKKNYVPGLLELHTVQRSVELDHDTNCYKIKIKKKCWNEAIWRKKIADYTKIPPRIDSHICSINGIRKAFQHLYPVFTPHYYDHIVKESITWAGQNLGINGHYRGAPKFIWYSNIIRISKTIIANKLQVKELGQYFVKSGMMRNKSRLLRVLLISATMKVFIATRLTGSHLLTVIQSSMKKFGIFGKDFSISEMTVKVFFFDNNSLKQFTEKNTDMVWLQVLGYV